LRPYVANNNLANVQESLNPILINELDIKGAINLKGNNIKVYGIKDFKIEKFRINLENVKVRV
jgi:hypothetical protein